MYFRLNFCPSEKLQRWIYTLYGFIASTQGHKFFFYWRGETTTPQTAALHINTVKRSVISAVLSAQVFIASDMCGNESWSGSVCFPQVCLSFFLQRLYFVSTFCKPLLFMSNHYCLSVDTFLISYWMKDCQGNKWKHMRNSLFCCLFNLSALSLATLMIHLRRPNYPPYTLKMILVCFSIKVFVWRKLHNPFRVTWWTQRIKNQSRYCVNCTQKKRKRWHFQSAEMRPVIATTSCTSHH